MVTMIMEVVVVVAVAVVVWLMEKKSVVHVVDEVTVVFDMD